MRSSLVVSVAFLTVCGFLDGGVQRVQGAPSALNTNLQIRLILSTTNNSSAHSVRIAKDPRTNQLYYLKINGDIFQVDLQPDTGSSSVRVYSAADHGLITQVEGFAIGPDGTMYVV